MPKVTLPSGAVIEGTLSEITTILGKVESFDRIKGFYRSESKGYVSITEMNSYHLRNAIAKKYRDWVGELNKLDPSAFIDSVRNGIDDSEFLELCQELQKRKVKGLL